MEDRRGVCLEEEVDRLKRSGMSIQEISNFVGLDPNWVATVVEMVPNEEEPTPEEQNLA